MQHLTNVRSNGNPGSIQIMNNEVIIPKNIHSFSVETDEGQMTGYEYDCDIYNKDEYLVIIAQQANRINELED
jgi:hypothetical protein